MIHKIKLNVLVCAQCSTTRYTPQGTEKVALCAGLPIYGSNDQGNN